MINTLLLLITFAINIYASANNKSNIVQFSNNSNSTSDRLAKIEWQDSNTATNIKRNFTDSQMYCKNLTLNDKDDWRVPSISELKYIFENKIKNNSIDFFWSSSQHESYDQHAWSLLFYNGETNYYNKSSEFSVICVRGNEYNDTKSVEQQIINTKLKKPENENNSSIETKEQNITVEKLFFKAYK